MKSSISYRMAGMVQGLPGLMVALTCGAIGLALSLPVAATVITATPNNDFSGATETTGFPTITFDDGGTSGSVEITIDLTDLLPTSAFTSDWWFNFSGDATLLTFQDATETAGDYAFPTFSTCNDCTSPSSFRPDGDGFFDVHLEFLTSSGERFDSGEIFTFDAVLAGITANDFNLLSIAGPGSTTNDFHCVATHAQGLTGGASDFLGVGECTTGGTPPAGIPEPNVLLLMAAGLLGLVYAGRRRPSRH